MQLRLKKAVDLSVLSMTEPAGKKARKLLPLTTKTHWPNGQDHKLSNKWLKLFIGIAIKQIHLEAYEQKGNPQLSRRIFQTVCQVPIILFYTLLQLLLYFHIQGCSPLKYCGN